MYFYDALTFCPSSEFSPLQKLMHAIYCVAFPLVCFPASHFKIYINFAFQIDFIVGTFSEVCYFDRGDFIVKINSEPLIIHRKRSVLAME